VCSGSVLRLFAQAVCSGSVLRLFAQAACSGSVLRQCALAVCSGSVLRQRVPSGSVLLRQCAQAVCGKPSLVSCVSRVFVFLFFELQCLHLFAYPSPVPLDHAVRVKDVG